MRQSQTRLHESRKWVEVWRLRYEATIPSVFLLDDKLRNQNLLGTQGHVRVSMIEEMPC